VWRNTDGKDMGLSGIYREVARPERTTWTELFDEDWTGGETLTTFMLTERQGRTAMVQTIRYASREARDRALRTGMEKGVGASFDRLEVSLRGGRLVMRTRAATETRAKAVRKSILSLCRR
jgi:uncharacterized protein YndB with AHSA1/START domain